MTPKAFAPSDFSFEVGQLFTRGEVCFRISDVRGPLLILEHDKTLERKAEDLASLEREYVEGRLRPGRIDPAAIQPLSPAVTAETVFLDGLPLDMGTPAQRRHVTSVMTYIQQLRSLGYKCLRPHPLLELDFRKLKAKRPDLVQLSLATVYAWSLDLDRADGDVRAVVPNFTGRGGRGNARGSAAFEWALGSAIEVVRADTSLKIRPFDLEDRARRFLISTVGEQQALAEMGSRSKIARRMRTEFTAYEIALRNKGEKAAKREFGTWYPRDRAGSPNLVVEFDDKDSRVFLIDERSTLPIGRGYVTSGVDQYSGVPMGTSISELPRSTWSALCALTNAIKPKDPQAPEFALVNTPVDYSGKMAIPVFDNALFNHANEIEIAAREIPIDPAWSRPFTPREKSVVEDFNGAMDEGFFSKEAGYGGPKGTTDRLDEGARCANAFVGDFIQRLNKWMYDDHCNSPGADGLTRRQRWHEGMRLFRPRYPVDIHRLELVPTLRHRLRLRAGSLRFTGLIYQNDHLKKLGHTLGPTAFIDFRFDPRNLLYVYVLDPIARLLFVVPNANPEYASGLTLYQHRLLRKMARQRGRSNPSIPQLMEEKEALRTLVAQTRFSKKVRQRTLAHRAEFPSPGPTCAARNSSAVAVSDLEGQVSDIDDVEMELDDEGWEVPAMI